jgi:catechol 2,3-dioxygenase-like lactoylglutathione lyase family enzyme
VGLPQRLTYITLGARDMPELRAFYGDLGWQERDGSSNEFTTFDTGGLVLALYPLDRLAAEAAPGEPAPPTSWNGVTLGLNVDSVEAVDAGVRTAVSAGATVVARPVRREWGGYSAYIADPEGNRWEITWAPGF